MSDDERREYQDPPIVEALCQFTFAKQLEWNVAIPGQLFEKLRSNYPKSPASQEVVQASFTPQANEGDANLTVNRGEQRILYSDKTGSRLFIANSVAASANSLRPYEGWPSLRRRLVDGFERLNEVVSVPGVSRVSIRYINRISVPLQAVDTDEYFTIPVRTAEAGKAGYSGFVSRVESVLRDGKTQANTIFASMPSENPSEVNFLLDFEFYRDYNIPIELEGAYTDADELKVAENQEFESSITDKARELFQ